MDWFHIFVLNCNDFILLFLPFNIKVEVFWTNDGVVAFTEDLKGEKDAGKEAKASKEETAKGNGKPPAERPRFMFNIADGGFTGES